MKPELFQQWLECGAIRNREKLPPHFRGDPPSSRKIQAEFQAFLANRPQSQEESKDEPKSLFPKLSTISFLGSLQAIIKILTDFTRSDHFDKDIYGTNEEKPPTADEIIGSVIDVFQFNINRLVDIIYVKSGGKINLEKPISKRTEIAQYYQLVPNFLAALTDHLEIYKTKYDNIVRYISHEKYLSVEEIIPEIIIYILTHSLFFEEIPETVRQNAVLIRAFLQCATEEQLMALVFAVTRASYIRCNSPYTDNPFHLIDQALQLEKGTHTLQPSGNRHHLEFQLQAVAAAQSQQLVLMLLEMTKHEVEQGLGISNRFGPESIELIDLMEEFVSIKDDFHTSIIWQLFIKYIDFIITYHELQHHDYSISKNNFLCRQYCQILQKLIRHELLPEESKNHIEGRRLYLTSNLSYEAVAAAETDHQLFLSREEYQQEINFFHQHCEAQVDTISVHNNIAHIKILHEEQEKLIIIENYSSATSRFIAIVACNLFIQNTNFHPQPAHMHYICAKDSTVKGAALMDFGVISTHGAIFYRPTLLGIKKHIEHELLHLKEWPPPPEKHPFYQEGMLYGLPNPPLTHSHRPDYGLFENETYGYNACNRHQQWHSGKYPTAYLFHRYLYQIIDRAYPHSDPQGQLNRIFSKLAEAPDPEEHLCLELDQLIFWDTPGFIPFPPLICAEALLSAPETLAEDMPLIAQLRSPEQLEQLQAAAADTDDYYKKLEASFLDELKFSQYNLLRPFDRGVSFNIYIRFHEIIQSAASNLLEIINESCLEDKIYLAKYIKQIYLKLIKMGIEIGEALSSPSPGYRLEACERFMESAEDGLIYYLHLLERLISNFTNLGVQTIITFIEVIDTACKNKIDEIKEQYYPNLLQSQFTLELKTTTPTYNRRREPLTKFPAYGLSQKTKAEMHVLDEDLEELGDKLQASYHSHLITALYGAWQAALKRGAQERADNYLRLLEKTLAVNLEEPLSQLGIINGRLRRYIYKKIQAQSESNVKAENV